MVQVAGQLRLSLYKEETHSKRLKIKVFEQEKTIADLKEKLSHANKELLSSEKSYYAHEDTSTMMMMDRNHQEEQHYELNLEREARNIAEKKILEFQAIIDKLNNSEGGSNNNKRRLIHQYEEQITSLLKGKEDTQDYFEEVEDNLNNAKSQVNETS